MRVEEFIEATNRSEDADEVFSLFKKAIAVFGYDRTIYCRIGPFERPAIVSNYPADWLSHYSSRGYVKTDPARLHCAISRRPFLWSDIAKHIPGNTIFHEAEEAGIRDGIGIAIHQPCGETLGVALASSHGKTDAAHSLSLLHLLALQFHAAYSARLLPPEPCGIPSLTPRQKEVLKWLAEGKSRWVIGEILGISEHAVDFHCRNIFRKLGVASGRMAVIKALQLGLIPL